MGKHTRYFYSVLLISLISTAMGFMTSCMKPLDKQKNVLKVQISADPVTVDPSLSEDGLSMQIIHNVMDGLLAHDAHGKLINQLADHWVISKDGLKYEFTLRTEARWSDDMPVRAVDFVTGIKRALSPKMGAKLAPLLFSIRGARAYHAGKSSELPGVYEKAGKLVIELEQVTPYFLEILTLANTLPLRQDILSDNGGIWPVTAPTTGPYRIAAYQPGRRFLLDKNDYYWGKRPSMSLVDILIVQDEATGVNLFEGGELDILTRIPPIDLPRLRSKGLVQQAPFLATYYLAFNTRKAPGNDRDFRRAVSGAIRRQEMVQALGAGESPARGWIPPGLEGAITYQDMAPLFADSIKRVHARAQALPTVLAGFDSSARNTLVMEKVQADLKGALGINILLSNMDWKSYISSLQTDPPTIYRMGWLAPFGDPISHMEVFTSGNLNNYTGWSNAQYDQKVSDIAKLEPGAAREKLLIEAQKLLIDDEAVVVPLYHYLQQNGVSLRLSGVAANPFGIIHFSDISLKDSAH
jgi:oligopeptide transport system substrate-binding protein